LPNFLHVSKTDLKFKNQNLIIGDRICQYQRHET
jgi:hypothetical protein